MKFVHRLAFYLGGVGIGIVLLVFFLYATDSVPPPFDYSPNARVLKNIRTKNLLFEEKTIGIFSQNKVDTAAVRTLLKDGDVLFSESNTALDSCKLYVIEGFVSEKMLKIKVENCSEIATVLEAWVGSGK